MNNFDLHVPVLLDECLEGLNIKEDGIYVDATLGRGGHSLNILKRLSNPGKIYCFDQDAEAIETSKEVLSKISPRYELIHSNFISIQEELSNKGVQNVDGILFDLGVSSPQLDDASRGFSYMKDAKLDMRMDKTSLKTAYDIVNNYSEKKLVEIFFEYGEEKFSRRIASKIVEKRSLKKIETTLELVDIIKSAIPISKQKDGHPAKRVFQAIRIEVNEELDSIKIALNKSLKILNKGGRICVITFHSLEDRIVKKIFKEMTTPTQWNKNMPITNDEEKIDFKLINKKPILPDKEELKMNKRSKSAKLRIIEKL